VGEGGREGGREMRIGENFALKSCSSLREGGREGGRKETYRHWPGVTLEVLEDLLQGEGAVAHGAEEATEGGRAASHGVSGHAWGGREGGTEGRRDGVL